VERTPHATFEIGLVVEDARAIDSSRLVASVALLHQPIAVAALIEVLPVVWLQAGYELSDVCEILLVEEMRTVAATTLLEACCIVVEHPFTTFAVDALVIRTHECFIEHPRLITIIVIKTQPLMYVLRLWHLSDDT
jgi:hypothetical protein